MADTAWDLYRILGTSRAATGDEIRTAYRELAITHHPDKGGDPTLWTRIQQAYTTLSDSTSRASYDRNAGDEVDTGAGKQFASGFVEQVDTKSKKDGLNIGQQIEAAKLEEDKMKDASKGMLTQAGLNMSHSAGFEAFLRNQKGTGRMGFYTAEDLLRKGNIAATDATSQSLPPLTTTAVRFDAHGDPAQVLYVDTSHTMPDKLRHGEVLVYIFAACVTDEDLLRVQSPLTALNEYPPFNRANNKWEEVSLPATAGVEGVGVVLATAKNVPGLARHALELKDWVLTRPDARSKPIGCWSNFAVADSSKFIKVATDLLPVQHLACSRALCTAYRLLEDYGGLKPGDAIIQNAADQPVGQAVIQLCKMLKIRSINLVTDDAGFDRTRDVLTELGATHVLRDNAKTSELLDALGQMMPRLAIDGLGGDHGRRMMLALRAGGAFVMHSLPNGQVPAMSPSLLMYQQISLHGFNLAQWVEEKGVDEYMQMLSTIGELVQAGSLNLFTRTLRVDELNAATLRTALASHRAVQDGQTFRERTVLVFGDDGGANEAYFDLQAKLHQMQPEKEADEPPLAPATGVPTGAAAAPRPRASERWADATAMLADLKLEQYAEQFVEEEMTSLELLEDIVSRGDGEKELMDALKEMGIKKMGHRQAIVGAVVGKL